eukprot:SAG31_NODE_564_length_14059_cov_5.728940_13_plen_108_part_00
MAGELRYDYNNATTVGKAFRHLKRLRDVFTLKLTHSSPYERVPHAVQLETNEPSSVGATLQVSSTAQHGEKSFGEIVCPITGKVADAIPCHVPFLVRVYLCTFTLHI